MMSYLMWKPFQVVICVDFSNITQDSRNVWSPVTVPAMKGCWVFTRIRHPDIISSFSTTVCMWEFTVTTPNILHIVTVNSVTVSAAACLCVTLNSDANASVWSNRSSVNPQRWTNDFRLQLTRISFLFLGVKTSHSGLL